MADLVGPIPVMATPTEFQREAINPGLPPPLPPKKTGYSSDCLLNLESKQVHENCELLLIDKDIHPK